MKQRRRSLRLRRLTAGIGTTIALSACAQSAPAPTEHNAAPSLLQVARRHGRWAAMALLLATHHLTCASVRYATTDLQLDFERHAVALNAESRNRLGAAVKLARSWCGFMFAFATGHADASEGRSSRSLLELSEARSAYVQQLLRQLGVPASRVYGEGKGATQPYFPWPVPAGQARLPSWSGRVDVLLQAEGRGPNNDGCHESW